MRFLCWSDDRDGVDCAALFDTIALEMRDGALRTSILLSPEDARRLAARLVALAGEAEEYRATQPGRRALYAPLPAEERE